MALCLLIQSSLQLLGPSLLPITRSDWTLCQTGVRAMEESRRWSPYLKSVPEKCVSGRKSGKNDNCAAEVVFACWRGSLVAGTAGED